LFQALFFFVQCILLIFRHPYSIFYYSLNSLNCLQRSFCLHESKSFESDLESLRPISFPYPLSDISSGIAGNTSALFSYNQLYLSFITHAQPWHGHFIQPGSWRLPRPQKPPVTLRHCPLELPSIWSANPRSRNRS